jgi:hypothetical protein
MTLNITPDLLGLPDTGIVGIASIVDTRLIKIVIVFILRCSKIVLTCNVTPNLEDVLGFYTSFY